MKPFLLIAPLLFSSACMFRAQPLGGASTLQIDANWNSDQREAELERREMRPAVIVTVSKIRSGIKIGRGYSKTIKVDHSAMAQDGHTFRLWQYLDTLKAEGVATDIEDPAPYLQRGSLVRLYWFLGAAPPMLGGTYLVRRWMNGDSHTLDDGAMLAGLSMIGVGSLGAYLGGHYYYKITEPVRKAMRKAKRQRGKWADTFNQGLVNKLGLGEASEMLSLPENKGTAPIKKDGVLLVPVTN